MTQLIQDIDYIINEEGNLVFTKAYLLKRGHCCQSGCTNCPYGYKDKTDPSVPAEFCDVWEDDSFNEDESDESE
jgi:hypothetical protein